jgi:hypothetical protein
MLRTDGLLCACADPELCLIACVTGCLVLVSLAAAQDREVGYVPGWLRFRVWLHGVAPGAYRRLASRYS